MMKYVTFLVLLSFFLTPSIGQIPVPKKKTTSTKNAQTANSPSTFLVVEVDQDCKISINGDEKGVIEGGTIKKISAQPGTNLIYFTSLLSGERIRKTVEVSKGRNEVVLVEFGKKETTATGGATLLITVDLDARVNVNGEEVGVFKAGIPQQVGVVPGINLVMATTLDDKRSLTQKVEVDRGKQALVEVALKTVKLELESMVFVQGGTFQMGDEFGDGDSDEKPVHSVTVSDFYISNHEVTFWEYAEYCAAKGIALPDDEGWGRGNRPVINVSWYDAVKYCNWRSEQEGRRPIYRIRGSDVSADWTADGYRLPTEAEWEYAARSRGKKEKWAGTSSESSLKEYANFFNRNRNIGKTQPVKSYEPNGLGLYDMSGNVWEWCWDWYDSGYYANSKDARDPTGPGTGSSRVRRGGSWFYGPRVCRAAIRDGDGPTFRYDDIGFRLALSSR